MRVQVLGIHIPAMSAIGDGDGLDDHDRCVMFLGDHQPMRELRRALSHATEPIYAKVEVWQLVEAH